MEEGNRSLTRGQWLVLAAAFLGWMFDGVEIGLFRYLTEFNAWFLFVVFVVGGITAAFYGWLPLYLPELFPTRIRATGQGLSFNFGRILAAGGTLCLGQFFGLFGGDYGRAMGAVALVYLLGMIVIWFAPETRGKPLPD